MTWHPTPTASAQTPPEGEEPVAGPGLEPGQVIFGAALGVGALWLIAAAVARRCRKPGDQGDAM